MFKIIRFLCKSWSIHWTNYCPLAKRSKNICLSLLDLNYSHLLAFLLI